MNDRIINKKYIIEILNHRTKVVRIILPVDYYKSNKSYPVLYMHDGQNLTIPSPYSNHSWEIIKTIDELHDFTQGIIIVGIDSDFKKRVLEYSPYISKSTYPYLKKIHKLNRDEIKPEADRYGEFIVNQLKPDIDKLYRTKTNKENTFIAGGSCGGIISLYLGIKYSNIFSCIGAFSSAFTVTKNYLYRYIKNKGIAEHLKIYNDMGTKENGILSFRMVYLHRKFNRFLFKLMDKSRILSVLDKGATHSEVFWSKRFKDYLVFCFK